MIWNFLLLLAICYGVFFFTLLLGHFVAGSVDDYYRTHPNSRTRRIFHRKPFKCGLCLSSWLTLINFSLLYLAFGSAIGYQMILTVFLAVFFLQWKEEYNMTH